jgi:uncharacterized membrane protein YphA (DoxX/SURF4 family)
LQARQPSQVPQQQQQQQQEEEQQQQQQQQEEEQGLVPQLAPMALYLGTGAGVEAATLWVEAVGEGSLGVGPLLARPAKARPAAAVAVVGAVGAVVHPLHL